MALKKWVLGKVHGHDESGAAPAAPSSADHEPTIGSPSRARTRMDDLGHLGPYEPLIRALREELERFAQEALRLHLSIAEHDRYVLTSIAVSCEGDAASEALLRRFAAEFKPEQIKRFIARDVIAGLRNASAIDLGQFAGLDVPEPRDDTDDDGYASLIAQLAESSPGRAAPFRVTLHGRWLAAPVAPGAVFRPARPAAPAAPRPAPSGTPLASHALALDVEDAGGKRHVEMPAVVPGRRYVIGKDAGCDVVVDGVYVSRRHCEIWFESSTWWVADAGSTNGIRVEGDAVQRLAGREGFGKGPARAAWPAGARLVLSANGEGDAREFPALVLAVPSFPMATSRTTSASAPATPIAPARATKAAFALTLHTPGGTQHAVVSDALVPFCIGRSRNQELVVDAAHVEVSGRHVEIVSVEHDGLAVLVHGDNGVCVDGRRYGSGERLRWHAGERLELGAAGAACRIELAAAS